MSESDYIYIIVNTNKFVFNIKDSYEIIPCKISLSIVYKNKLLYDNTFLTKYNLYDSYVFKNNKSKLLYATNYLKNKNCYFPTKEHKGKNVIKFYHMIGNDANSIKYFIKSILLIIQEYYNKQPIVLSSDSNNVKWLMNKLDSNNLITENNLFTNIGTNIIADINIDDCENINKFLINHILSTRSDNRLIQQEDENLVSIIGKCYNLIC